MYSVKKIVNVDLDFKLEIRYRGEAKPKQKDVEI